jgi:hypothetical protein
MKESLTINFSITPRTITARSGVYKASASHNISRMDVVQNLVQKIFGFVPANLRLEQSDRGTWTFTWEEAA